MLDDNNKSQFYKNNENKSRNQESQKEASKLIDCERRSLGDDYIFFFLAI